MNKIKSTFAGLGIVMIITVLGCINSPVSNPDGGGNSQERTLGATTIQAEKTIQATIANPRTNIPTNKIGTQEGNTTPEFTLAMSDWDTKIFPAILQTDKPIFLLFFTPH